ncbi:hypothetical protein ILP92_10545 [Maribius pontilimi]|uniref:Uncharacterized protein n=1 Tax=Palleronia pontilimi TaxID=1964209 RepID=A0A934IHT8_9RHOB|nr:hypothetical protein [Palleronia pontilimi]MBJ3763183.1 hypothetical protein [Palleronia pontilimi]
MSDLREQQLRSLADLAHLIKERELGKVANIVAHMNRLKADVAQIERAKETRQNQTDLDAARLSGAEVAWMAWTDAQLARNQAQLAALRVTHEAALRAASKAFGRSDVLRKLADPERNR